ncbi:MAG: hypothetical protein AMXMBFR16_00090 [Candidatus Uhrbacteria bacterium]|jgi:hypothetical protein
MKKVLWTVIALVLAPISALALGMSSTNYLIEWDSINAGGDDVSSSTNFQIRDTLGQFVSGDGQSTNFQLRAGYRVGETQEPFLSIDNGTQENSTETTWTSFSSSTNQVDVGNPTVFTVDNYIGLVENKGFGQFLVFGKITGIAGSTITVDKWDGDTNLLSGSPAGGNDFAYKANGNVAALGVQAPGQESTSFTLTSIATNAQNGYTVTVGTDGDLRSGSSTIRNVADGTVTAGNEEYGGEVVGSSATGTGMDFALTTSTRDIQLGSAHASDERTGLIYKLSIDVSTPTGNFSHNVQYRLTANF